MARFRHLRNAPITEAVIDLRVTPTVTPSQLDVERFSSLPTEIRERYPQTKPIRTAGFEFGLVEGQPKIKLPQDLGIYAYRFEAADGKQIAIFKRDGFSFSRLSPYTDWQSVSSESRRLWEAYTKMAELKSITRIAVRYINHLKLPLPMSDFKDYLTAPPHVPRKAPQVVSSFLTRVVVHDIERQLDANIIQAMERSPTPDSIVVIIDIDAYKLGEFDPKSDEIWDILSQLRVLKNEIFFSSIRERTARLFE